MSPATDISTSPYSLLISILDGSFFIVIARASLLFDILTRSAFNFLISIEQYCERDTQSPSIPNALIEFDLALKFTLPVNFSYADFIILIINLNGTYSFSKINYTGPVFNYYCIAGGADYILRINITIRAFCK